MEVSFARRVQTEYLELAVGKRYNSQTETFLPEKLFSFDIFENRRCSFESDQIFFYFLVKEYFKGMFSNCSFKSEKKTNIFLKNILQECLQLKCIPYHIKYNFFPQRIFQRKCLQKISDRSNIQKKK